MVACAHVHMGKAEQVVSLGLDAPIHQSELVVVIVQQVGELRATRAVSRAQVSSVVG